MKKEEARQRTVVIYAELDKLYRIWNPLQFVLLVAVVLNIYITSTDQVFADRIQLFVSILFVICFIGGIGSGLKMGRLRREQDKILSEHGICSTPAVSLEKTPAD